MDLNVVTFNSIRLVSLGTKYDGWLKDLEKPITLRTEARLAELYTR